MNYIEYNRNALKDALGRLPRHRPPEGLWERIKTELAQGDKEQVLKDALSQLPAHSPSPDVWEAIEASLERPPRFRLRRFIWAAAASIAVLIAWSLFHLSGDAGSQPVYSYDTQKANLELFTNDWEEDEKVLKALVEQFSQDPLAKRQEQYGRLLDEWKELEEAKAEAIKIMELYGKDARLVRQISEIERERSQVAKAMALAI